MDQIDQQASEYGAHVESAVEAVLEFGEIAMR
jgi:hypothetical protein